ncbi:hypothetical protein EJ04DRAFT_605768 [Polyplosphaeria fusca]|uniref:C2H2-type domain-containing protein n=1 Tax=Polyplosphaeria fusca TaxID=682080 RepID=A0A9P4UYK4_9PLEO|nr:hypothetical protein EJ04DRAFT_605768 [Polyplosphaeria fusca]
MLGPLCLNLVRPIDLLPVPISPFVHRQDILPKYFTLPALSDSWDIEEIRASAAMNHDPHGLDPLGEMEDRDVLDRLANIITSLRHRPHLQPRTNEIIGVHVYGQKSNSLPVSSAGSATAQHSVHPVPLDPASISLRTTRRPQRSYFCTFCMENGKLTSFKAKSDWMRHESNFHETGTEWACQVPGCSQAFARERDIANHHKERHPGLNAKFTGRTLPNRRVYGCGLSGCRFTAASWKERCDHVAGCMQIRSSWTFTNRILTLLNQEPIHEKWLEIRNLVCCESRFSPQELQWGVHTSRHAMELLESGKVGPSSTELFQKIARIGIQTSMRLTSSGANETQLVHHVLPGNTSSSKAQPIGNNYVGAMNDFTLPMWDSHPLSVEPGMRGQSSVDDRTRAPKQCSSVIMLDASDDDLSGSLDPIVDYRTASSISSQTIVDDFASSFSDNSLQEPQPLLPYNFWKPSNRLKKTKGWSTLKHSDQPIEQTNPCTEQLQRGLLAVAVPVPSYPSRTSSQAFHGHFNFDN